ncbi:MAG: DegT/DnrJ/EryC1/StrS family aminotransferase [Bacteroidia bacterium]|nr:DegT/DnrJ/EryC1/StrS family aminotransferase [Bacteroidia bacterium]
MEIRMVDTISQYQQVQEQIDQAVLDVVRSGIFINGPKVRGFAAEMSEFLDVPHVIPCANGTDALQVALMAMGLEPGDEVITPTFTYVATVEVISLLQLRPVFVEVNPDTFNMDPSSIEEAITEKTKVILPVHLYGQAAEMEAIMAIAKKHNLFVLEDTAQAIGAKYKFSDGREMSAGTIGDIGTTSFYPSKNLGAYGDGGAIFSRNAELGDYLQVICNHGAKKKYYHDNIGVNSRLDAIQAAILSIKLKHLNRYNSSRIAAAKVYDELLSGIQGVKTPVWEDDGSHVFHQYTLKIEAGRAVRDEIKDKLKERGIPSMIYYPIPIHMQGGYTKYGYKEGDFPLSEKLTEQVLSLPMHSELTREQQEFICGNFREIFNELLTKIN